MQQLYGRIPCRGRRNVLLGQPVASLDIEVLRVMVSCPSWRVDERRVSAGAVTRHTMFAAVSVLVGTVDVDGKIHGSPVTVEFCRQTVLNDPTPAFREFLLDRLSPADDWHHVGVIVHLKQRETLAVVKSAAK